MSSTTRPRPHKLHQSPPPQFDQGEWCVGPLAGQRLKVQMQAEARLYLSTPDRKRQCVYAGNALAILRPGKHNADA